MAEHTAEEHAEESLENSLESSNLKPDAAEVWDNTTQNTLHNPTENNAPMEVQHCSLPIFREGYNTNYFQL